MKKFAAAVLAVLSVSTVANAEDYACIMSCQSECMNVFFDNPAMVAACQRGCRTGCNQSISEPPGGGGT